MLRDLHATLERSDVKAVVIRRCLGMGVAYNAYSAARHHHRDACLVLCHPSERSWLRGSKEDESRIDKTDQSSMTKSVSTEPDRWPDTNGSRRPVLAKSVTEGGC